MPGTEIAITTLKGVCSFTLAVKSIAGDIPRIHSLDARCQLGKFTTDTRLKPTKVDSKNSELDCFFVVFGVIESVGLSPHDQHLKSDIDSAPVVFLRLGNRT